MYRFFYLLLLIAPVISRSQSETYFRVKPDSSGFELTLAGARHLASLPLKCMDQEFPNKTNHTSVSDSDHVLLPSRLHPVFYGCFDWHSAVHGHWMLVRLLKAFPALPEAKLIREKLSNAFTKEKVEGELKYFSLPLTGSWERTYGWAWLLKLDEELQTWADPDARKWQEALQPLTRLILQRWTEFLPKQTYANRTGVHPNTAFGLVMALDYARSAGNKSFEEAIVKASLYLFEKDRKAPAVWEPNGADFLSPSLEEADLMRRVLKPASFREWFHRFLSPEDIKHLSRLPVVSDRTDLQIVHLDGLCFSRSWCMMGLARSLPASDPAGRLLKKAAIRHLAAALPHVVSGHYGGEHWLASFAVYALLNS